MSWSRSFASLEDFMQDKGTPEAPLEGPAVNAYITARQCAEKIIAEKVLGGNGAFSSSEGGNTKDFVVYLSGHANPDHEPVKGWANDCLTVMVTQK